MHTAACVLSHLIFTTTWPDNYSPCHFLVAESCGLWDLSALTRNRTHVLHAGSPGNPLPLILNAQPEPGLSPDPIISCPFLPTLKAERIPDLARQLWV